MKAAMEYSHWGIWVASYNDLGQSSWRFFAYPVGPQGPVESLVTEQQAVEHYRMNGGEDD